MLQGLNPLELLCLLVAGVVLDLLLGEPRRFHPLIGFGALANRIERALNRSNIRWHALQACWRWYSQCFPL